MALDNYPSSDSSPMFSKIRVGHLTLKNRIMMGPIVTGLEGDKDLSELAHIVAHDFLEKVHSCESHRQFLRDKQHDHRRAAADHDRIDKYAKCLDKSDLYRVTLLRRCRCTRCGTGTGLVGEQTALDSDHENRAKTASCDLAESECLLKNPLENARNASEMRRDDEQGDHKITSRHDRNDHIQRADRSIFS